MRVWESRSPPAYRTTSDEPVSSEVVSILCVSLADFRRVFSQVLKSSQISLRIFRGVLKGSRISRRVFSGVLKSSQISQISQILRVRGRSQIMQRAYFAFLGCFLRKMRAQIGVFTAFSREIRENVTFSSEINNNYPPSLEINI